MAARKKPSKEKPKREACVGTCMVCQPDCSVHETKKKAKARKKNKPAVPCLAHGPREE